MSTADVAARSSLLSQHAAHLLALGIPVAMLFIGLAADSWHRRHKARGASQRPIDRLPLTPALRAAAAASAAAAAVHLLVLPEHIREAAIYGAFFAVLATCQVGCAAVLLVRRSQAMTALVGLGNAAVIVLWLFTRLVEVPVGPGSGSVESFGVLDVAASLFEAAVVGGCLLSLRMRMRMRTRMPMATAEVM